MTLETLIGGLSREEQIVAMELLWKRLTTESPSDAPPDWHRSVVAERVAAIESGEETLSDWAVQRNGLRIVFDEDQDFGWCRPRHCGWLR